MLNQKDQFEPAVYSFKSFSVDENITSGNVSSFTLHEITRSDGPPPPKPSDKTEAVAESVAEIWPMPIRPSLPDPAEEAKKIADSIIAEARAEAIRVVDDARRSGQEQGYKQGYEQGTQTAVEEQDVILKEALKFYMEDIKKAVEKLESQKASIISDYLDELRDLAVTIAEKVIGVSLKSSGEIIERMILTSAEQSKNRQWAKIYLSKHDADLIMEGDAKILDSLQDISEHIKITVMENEDPGTCIVEFPDQIVDASVKTQIQNIKDILELAQEQE